MGEVLRAVLDATCIDSNPAFYTVRVDQLTTVTGVRTFADRSGAIKLKSDVWFMMCAWCFDNAFAKAAGGGPYGWETKTNAASFLLTSLNTGQDMANGLTLKSNCGYNLNNIIYMPEYKLFEPNDAIAVRMNIQVTDSADAYNDWNFLTLLGIEYRMPAGKGFSNGGK